MLGLLVSPDLSLEAIAALFGIEIADAARRTERLSSACMVVETRPGRFSIHDLLREYAETLLSEHDSLAALSRLTRWYLEHADAACRPLSSNAVRLRDAPAGGPTFPGNEAALSWSDAERVNVVAVAAQAAEMSLPEAILLTDTLRPYLGPRWPRELLAIADQALSLAIRSGDARSEVAMRVARSNALLRAVDGDAAVAEAKLAHEVSARIDWPEAARPILSSLTTAYINSGGLAEALHYGQKFLEASVGLGPVDGQQTAHSRLSVVYQLLGDLRAASFHAEQSLIKVSAVEAERLGALINAADTNRLRGDFELSLAQLSEALGMTGDTRNQFATTYVHLGLAALHRDMGDADQASNHVELATSVYQDPRLEGQVHIGVIAAGVSALRGHLAKAVARWEKTLQLAANVEIRHPETEAYIGYADALRAC